MLAGDGHGCYWTAADIRILESAQKLAASWMEVRPCILQDLHQPRQTLTARGAVHMECNKLLCGCASVLHTRYVHTLT